MSSEREEAEKMGAVIARLETHGEQIEKLFVLHRETMKENHKWQAEVRGDIQYFRIGVDQLKSEMKSYEHNRQQEYAEIARHIDDRVNSAPCNSVHDHDHGKINKNDRMELLRLWLIFLISIAMFLGAFFNGSANMTAVAGKLLP